MISYEICHTHTKQTARKVLNIHIRPQDNRRDNTFPLHFQCFLYATLQKSY